MSLLTENFCLESALIVQKNRVLAKLNNAEDGSDLLAILETLRVLLPVWNAVGYGYKGREVAQRIYDIAAALRNDLETELASMRANDRMRGYRATDLNKCNSALGEAYAIIRS